MRLYHGTTEEVARLAVKEGLMPRCMTSKTNWAHSIESKEDAVYLTSAYAGHFAMVAAGMGRWGILEVETDLLESRALVPDEDFLEQASRRQKVSGLRAKTMKGRTKWFRSRLLNWAHIWEESVHGLGTCAYIGRIPPEAITRCALFDPRANPAITVSIDPTISLMNYNICGNKYRAISRWLIGDEATVDDVFMFVPPDQRELAVEALKNRAGWELLQTAHA